MDGKKTDFSEEDVGRRNTICNLLEQWGLLKIVDPSKIESPRALLSHIKVITFKEKDQWELCTKYTIGRKKPVEE